MLNIEMIQWQRAESIECMISGGFALSSVSRLEFYALSFFWLFVALRCGRSTAGFFSAGISNYRQTLLVSLTRVTSCLSRVKTNEPLISIFCVLMIFESGLWSIHKTGFAEIAVVGMTSSSLSWTYSYNYCYGMSNPNKYKYYLLCDSFRFVCWERNVKE